MAKKSKRSRIRLNLGTGNWLRRFFHFVWRGGFWRKLLTAVAAIILFFTGVSYGVAEWYIHKHNSEPLVLGTSFIPEYAESLGVDPKATFEAILTDLNIKQVRLVSYWNQIEKTPGTYDFSMLDWEFEQANKHGAKISLAIGLRQPRWPECHEPDWVTIDSKKDSTWEPQLYKFMNAVVDRYKSNPALADYELENEFFMKVFGECKDFDRNRLINEFRLVKKWDPNHKVIISRSDNWIGVPVGQPTPDQFAISVYKRVWDSTFTKRYFEYPLPPWFYASLAGYEELISGRDMIIHELQAEPWTPHGLDLNQTSVKEQFKSMNADRMQKRIQYGIDTGMRTIDLWGAEWWYWLKEKQHDDSVWKVVKQSVIKSQLDNQKLNK